MKMFSTKGQNPLIKVEKYGNFHTIDWLKDQAKDRFRHMWLIKEKVLINKNKLNKFSIYFLI